MMRWVGTKTLEIPPNRDFELFESIGFDVELPLQAGAYLAEGRCAGDAPGLSVIAGKLGSDREGTGEEVAPGGGWVVV